MTNVLLFNKIYFKNFLPMILSKVFLCYAVAIRLL